MVPPKLMFFSVILMTSDTNPLSKTGANRLKRRIQKTTSSLRQNSPNPTGTSRRYVSKTKTLIFRKFFWQLNDKARVRTFSIVLKTAAIFMNNPNGNT